MSSDRQRPRWVDSLNASARNLGAGAASVVSLDEVDILRAAADASGSSDFGDAWFREPLGVLLRALEEEAEVTLLGRIFARTEIQRALQNRLAIEATYRTHPEIAAERIDAPVFITGLGRSGTTLLHELFACDPRNRMPLQWELMYSVPPPETATYETDPRIDRVRAEISLREDADPAFPSMHQLAADQPTECIYLFNHQCASEMFLGEFFVPSYALWLAGRDWHPLYDYHQRILKLLQWHKPGERWVLKAPSHLSHLPTLLDIYPDARIVMMHRDPLRVLGSLTNLIATLQRMRSDQPIFEGTAEMMSAGFATMLARVIEQRASGAVGDDRIVDVLYTDLVADPLSATKRIYRFLDIAWSAEAEKRMTRYLTSRRHGERTGHIYDFAATGLDRDRQREQYQTYMAHYDVPLEV